MLRRLELDIFPYLGNRPIAAITAPDVLDALRKIEAREALDIAARVRSICSQIFRFGIQTGKCPADHNPVIHLAGAFKTLKTQHFAALESKEIHSLQVIAILKEQRNKNQHINTPWVFPSPIRPRDPMSDGTVLVALKRMGFKGCMTAHGFRALARTTIREQLDYEPDVIEAQLAHKAAGRSL